MPTNRSAEAGWERGLRRNEEEDAWLCPKNGNGFYQSNFLIHYSAFDNVLPWSLILGFRHSFIYGVWLKGAATFFQKNNFFP